MTTNTTNDTIVNVQTSEKIPVKLNSREVYSLAVRTVEMAKEHDALEEEFAAVKKEWTKKLKESESKLGSARASVLSKTEWREVEGTRVYNLTTGFSVFRFANDEYSQKTITDKERDLLRQQVAENDLFGDVDEDELSEEGQAELAAIDDETSTISFPGLSGAATFSPTPAMETDTTEMEDAADYSDVF